MPSFLDRYRNGEHQQVWADLNSLGPGVREEAYLDDAYAVAQETMRRARGNVETLVVRLEKLGYEFLSDQKSASESLHGLNQAMAMLKAMDQFTSGHPNPHVDKLRERSRSMLDNPLFKGVLGKLEQRAAEPVADMSLKDPSALKNPNVFSPPAKDAAQDLREFENSIAGPIPLSLRAWCEIVGSVSLMGTHPVLSFRERAQGGPTAMFMDPSMFSAAGDSARLNAITEVPTVKETPLADPLVVDGEPEAWFVDECPPGETRHISLAPDDLSKAEVSGDAYYMEVPNPSADAVFQDWHNANFVDYLRIAFRWGGFPGWQRYQYCPEKELAYLAEGLLDI